MEAKYAIDLVQKWKKLYPKEQHMKMVKDLEKSIKPVELQIFREGVIKTRATEITQQELKDENKKIAETLLNRGRPT